MAGDTILQDELVLIVYNDRRYLKRVEEGKAFHGKGGILPFSDVIGKSYGTNFGEYDVFRPTIEDVIMYGIRRETQIAYPKDAFFLATRLDIRNGSRVLEVGTGSGALTLLFSRMAGVDGRLVSIEREERHYRNAVKNIERFREIDNIDLVLADVMDFDGEGFDQAFVDVREPWLYLEKVHAMMKGSAPLGIIVPTTNQICETLPALTGFGDIEVLEIMLRRYKPVAQRLRPEDRMVAHTGYLIFGRKTISLCTDKGG